VGQEGLTVDDDALDGAGASGGAVFAGGGDIEDQPAAVGLCEFRHDLDVRADRARSAMTELDASAN
jgi:hypothetical protein